MSATSRSATQHDVVDVHVNIRELRGLKGKCRVLKLSGIPAWRLVGDVTAQIVEQLTEEPQSCYLLKGGDILCPVKRISDYWSTGLLTLQGIALYEADAVDTPPASPWPIDFCADSYKIMDFTSNSAPQQDTSQKKGKRLIMRRKPDHYAGGPWDKTDTEDGVALVHVHVRVFIAGKGRLMTLHINCKGMITVFHLKQEILSFFGESPDELMLTLTTDPLNPLCNSLDFRELGGIPSDINAIMSFDDSIDG